MSNSVEIFFIAGENSGDQPGGKLVGHIGRLRPDWSLVGLGGPHMEAAGMRLLRNMVNDLAIVGIVEVITKAHKIWKVRNLVRRYLDEHRPKAVVLIDYPGFNLKLIAPFAHKLGLTVIYYIVPQFWVWDYERVHKLREYCSLVVPILPFEETLLRKEGVEATYLGHPKRDLIILTMDRDKVCEEFGFDPAKKLIGMMPGSRRREVRVLLPRMLKAAGRVLAVRDDVQFALIRNETTPRDLIDTYIDEYGVPVTVIERQRYNVRAAMDFCWVKSGTSTLESALLGVPFCVVYRVNYFTFLLAKLLVKTSYISLPNIVADEEVVPELLQEQATGQNMADTALHYLNDREANEAMRYQLGRVRDQFGDPGSSERTARAIVDLLDGDGPSRDELQAENGAEK